MSKMQIRDFLDKVEEDVVYDEGFINDVVDFLGSKISAKQIEPIISTIVESEKLMEKIIDDIFSSKKLLSKILDKIESKILSGASE